MKLIPVKDLIPTPENNRTAPKKTDPDILELAESIKGPVGQLQPGLARIHPKKKGKYDLRCGARRHMACSLAGVDMLVIVRDLTDQEALEVTVLENLQREDLTPMEEARGIRLLIEKDGWNTEAVASHIGKPVKWVQRRNRLNTLTKAWQEKAADPDSWVSSWSPGHLEVIAKLEPEAQDDFLKEVSVEYIDSIGELQHHVDNYIMFLGKAPWPLDDLTFSGKLPACAACKSRASYNPGLFDEDLDTKNIQKDKCLNRICWGKKQKEYVARQKKKLQEKHDDLVLVKAAGNYSLTEEEKKAGVISKYSTTGSRKDAKRSRPALDIETGQLSYVTLDYEVVKNGSAKAAGQPTPLKERRAKLKRRHDFWIVSQVIEMLTGSGSACGQKPKQPDHPTMVSMALVFGIKGSGGHWSGRWADYKRIKGETPATRDKALWKLLRDTMRDHIHDNYDPRIIQTKKLCEVIGVDFKVLQEAAAEKMPDPKIWGTLNEDGTPKKKPAKKKKAAKKKAATKKKPKSGKRGMIKTKP